jgi:hypothetical protein
MTGNQAAMSRAQRRQRGLSHQIVGHFMVIGRIQISPCSHRRLSVRSLERRHVPTQLWGSPNPVPHCGRTSPRFQHSGSREGMRHTCGCRWRFTVTPQGQRSSWLVSSSHSARLDRLGWVRQPGGHLPGPLKPTGLPLVGAGCLPAVVRLAAGQGRAVPEGGDEAHASARCVCLTVCLTRGRPGTGGFRTSRGLRR